MYWKGGQPRWGNSGDLNSPENMKDGRSAPESEPAPKEHWYSFSQDAEEDEKMEALSNVNDSLGDPELDKIMVSVYLQCLRSFKDAKDPAAAADGFAAAILGLTKSAVACFVPVDGGKILLSVDAINEHIDMLARRITEVMTEQIKYMKMEVADDIAEGFVEFNEEQFNQDMEDIEFEFDDEFDEDDPLLGDEDA
jgi:predicted transcriptional regulator